MNSNQRTVFELVALIPKGKIATYGQIGKYLGINPRQVGRILHQNPDPKKYPCHRIIKSDGSFALGYAFGGKDAQIKELKKEGAVFLEKDKVDLSKCLFDIKAVDKLSINSKILITIPNK